MVSNNEGAISALAKELSSLQGKLAEVKAETTDQYLASEFHKRLAEWIQDFDASLDQEHEVGIRLVSFRQADTFHLQNMAYWNPSLIVFRGSTDQGDPVELIQHVSQISVLLIKLKRTDTSQPKRPIGFASWGDAGDNQT